MDWGQGLIAPALFIFIINSIMILSIMVVLWQISILIKNIGIIDIFWAFGVFLTALTAFLFGSGLPERKLLMLLLVGIWAFRLSGYIFIRFLQKKKEDPRYTALRRQRSELQILGLFLLQGIAILVLSTPFLSISFDQNRLNILDYLGIAVALFAILGETVADRQLYDFCRNHSGKVCNVSLWSKSRHPNFFFEWLFWIGIALIAMPAPFGITGIIACALMLCIFLFFSIPVTEQQLLKSKPDAYKKYQQEVPSFFPCLK